MTPTDDDARSAFLHWAEAAIPALYHRLDEEYARVAHCWVRPRIRFYRRHPRRMAGK